MFALLEAFFVEYGYAAVFFVLVICGFGVPIPEDLTLVTGGVISGMGYTNPHIMFAVGMLGVLAGDGIMFAAGRIWGQKILKFKPIARIMTPKRYAQVQEKFDKYGNWVLFVARFLPGLRTAVFVTMRHQPQSIVSALSDYGRACRADFRARLDLLGRVRRAQHRLADGENAQPAIGYFCYLGYRCDRCRLDLVEKTPTYPVLPQQIERKAGATQSRQGSQKSRAKQTIKSST